MAGMALLLLQSPPATALLLHPPRRIISARASGTAVMQAEERWAIMQPPGDTAPLPRLELELDSGGSCGPPREPPSGGGDGGGGGGGGGDDETGGTWRDLRSLMLGPWAATQSALQAALPAVMTALTMATRTMPARTMARPTVRFLMVCAHRKLCTAYHGLCTTYTVRFLMTTPTVHHEEDRLGGSDTCPRWTPAHFGPRPSPRHWSVGLATSRHSG